MGTTDTTIDSKPIKSLSYGVGTDVGRKREENQDSYGVINTEYLKFYIVADGMGGAKGGAMASSVAVKTVEQNLGQYHQLTPDDIARTLSQANSDIFKRGASEEGFAGMGTTIVGIAFFATNMMVINVGDSRAYRIRGNKIVQMTDDHTLVNDLVKNGAITEDQAKNHPVAHMLTRSLGPCPDVDVDAFIVEDGPAADDRYVLCSDGLYNVVADEEILAIVKNNSIDEAVQELISLANERGGPDNITIIIVHVGDDYPKKAADFTELEYPIVEQRNLPKTDVYDIRATRDQYKSGKYKREPDDSDIQLISTPRLRSAPDTNTPPVPIPHHSSMVHLKWAGLMVLGLVMGFLLSETSSYFKHKAYTEIRTVLINPLATEIARLPMNQYTFAEPEMELSLFVSERVRSIRENRSRPDSYQIKTGLSKNQIEGVKQRRQTIQEELAKIKSQLAVLDNPNNRPLTEQKEKIVAEIKKLESDQLALTQELNNASNTLVTWIERKQRLSTVDPVDMASEIAFVSSFVRERKELFEKATWAYLREVEVWRFSPNDKELTQKISELGRAREQRRNDLASAVGKTVDQEKESIEQEISELSAKNKSLQAQLEGLKNELNFIALSTGSDTAAKLTYRTELLKQQEIARTELDELNQMLVD